MNTQGPKTPPSSRRLALRDLDTTPKSSRKRPPASIQTYAGSRTPPRRNSFEEIEVTALPDPRTPEHISFQDVWKGPFLEFSRNAVIEFLPALEAALARVNRIPEYNRFFCMLQSNAKHATVELDVILDEACRLFGWDAELVHAFNDILPPGYRIETHRDYIAVFTPCGGWTEDRGGTRAYHPVIPSSSRSP
ncbi:hypothetical protein C8Q77DRAFT_1156175 [Trametes polyzona]|nr:hypothetical protein C8Q77DRAFT_1156175 [Trametes polyzona]